MLERNCLLEFYPQLWSGAELPDNNKLAPGETAPPVDNQMDNGPPSKYSNPGKSKRKGGRTRGPYYKELINFMEFQENKNVAFGGIGGFSTRSLAKMFKKWCESRHTTFHIPGDSTLRAAVDQARVEIEIT